MGVKQGEHLGLLSLGFLICKMIRLPPLKIRQMESVQGSNLMGEKLPRWQGAGL